jgi:hypothetical protein
LDKTAARRSSLDDPSSQRREEAHAPSAENRSIMPEYVRDSTEDEMVLEFIKAESLSNDWVKYYSFPDGFSYDELITKADLRDRYQNTARRSMLNYRGYATRTELFAGFPLDVQWSIQRFSIAEIAGFKYANVAPWSYLAGPDRLVREGADAIGEDPQRVVGLGIHIEKLEAIREVLKSGVILARFIVAEVGKTDVIVEGHMRATALAGLPGDRKYEALVGRADDFKQWQCR